jgi:hypothetical protein
MSANGLAASIALAMTAMLLMGCSPASHSYQLSRQGNTAVLIPPGVKLPAEGTLNVKLRNARRAPFPQAGCEMDRGPITIEWRGSTAYVRAKSGSDLLGFGQNKVHERPVALDPRGSVSGEPVALAPLQYINEFRSSVIGLEENGCLHPGEGETLAVNIAEKLPFQPFISYLLHFGAFDVNQFVDLTPDFRLRVVYPTYSADKDSKTTEIKGVDTVYYEIVSDQKDGRVRISRAIGKDPSQDRLASPFSSSPAYFRLFLRKSLSSKNPVTVAIVLSSTDRKNLDEATKQLDADVEPSCRAVASSSASCVMFPPLTGVNAEIRVRANGKDAYAELGARVDQLLHELGTDDIPQSVQIRRLFDKRLVSIRVDSDNKDLLALVLMPGDVINYR